MYVNVKVDDAYRTRIDIFRGRSFDFIRFPPPPPPPHSSLYPRVFRLAFPS